MCGIIGEFSNKSIEESQFRKMTSLLSHRGIDDSGVYIDGQVALGHTRLSIIDLSRDAHQPMSDRDGRYTIVYNGEIYNYQELRRELLSRGCLFESLSDTEVILNGFIEYGERVVDRLDGMFSFVIYDRVEGELFMARDRDGIKPLYYYLDGDRFTFSSEIKVLEKYSSGISMDAEILFLLLGYVPEPITIYKDIAMFPAGEYAYYKNGKLKREKYNRYNYEPKIIKPYGEIVDDVTDLLHKSIKSHLISDAPIGIFLSGGLDSSAITSIASRYQKELKTISLVFDETSLNEEYYQDLIVDRYRTEHTKYMVTKDRFFDNVDRFISHMDQPTIDGLNTFFVSGVANEIGLKSVLSGVGGDEIFYGYKSFRDARKLNFLSGLPYPMIKILQKPYKYRRLELLRAEGDLSCYLPTRSLFAPTDIADILHIDISYIYRLISNLWEEYNSSHITLLDDKISFFEMNLYMKNQLLRDADIFGMANSIEIRVPFLDRDLVDYLQRVEPNHKYDKMTNKILLADATRSLLPREIIDRPKAGFVLPFEKWLRSDIDRFDMGQGVRDDFLHGRLSWSRAWADIVLKKFEMGSR